MKQLVTALALTLALPITVFGADNLDYRNAAGLPVTGTLAPNAENAYTRLPDSLHNVAREEVWALGQNSAGISVRFRSDSPSLGVKWHSRNRFNMNHMTPTGIRGLDLYMLMPDSTWTFVNSGRPSLGSSNSTSRLIEGLEPGTEREYMLYLSLYDGVDSLYIGVDSTATLLPPAVNLPKRHRPIVMYGTSILQGGCATRPGMAHTNILQRRLNREVINLGFSGNARLDPEIAHLMAQAEASLYVIDAMPNCTADLVSERMDAFIDILREAHPDTPILLVESPLFPIMRFNAETAGEINEKNRRLREIYERRASTDSNLHYFEADKILNGDTECTVDNYHFTDGGFESFAERLLPVISRIALPAGHCARCEKREVEY